MRRREEILWELLDDFSTALEDILRGDPTTAEDFIKEFPEATKDLDLKLRDALKRGLFLILKSKELIPNTFHGFN